MLSNYVNSVTYTLLYFRLFLKNKVSFYRVSESGNVYQTNNGTRLSSVVNFYVKPVYLFPFRFSGKSPVREFPVSARTWKKGYSLRRYSRKRPRGPIELQISKTTRKNSSAIYCEHFAALHHNPKLLLLFAVPVSLGKSTTSLLTSTVKHIPAIVVIRWSIAADSDNKFSRCSRAKLYWRHTAWCKVRCRLQR